MTDWATPDDASTVDAPSVAPGPSPRRRWSRGRRIGALAVVGAVLLVAMATIGRIPSSRTSVESGDVAGIVDEAVQRVVDERVEELESAPAASVAVYDTIVPSLVVIRSERAGTAGDGTGLGTGVIVDDRGAILTALHVVEGGTQLRVSFADGTDSAATISSADPENDIAVLATERGPEVIVPAVLGSTGGVHVGDEAYAVGHPLGLVGSLSAGVISGLDRSVPRGDGGTLGGLIQFDAAVNPGSSGGPLLNRHGQVIGIVTALANPSETSHFIGIGFAVPITTAGGAAGAPSQ